MSIMYLTSNICSGLLVKKESLKILLQHGAYEFHVDSVEAVGGLRTCCSKRAARR